MTRINTHRRAAPRLFFYGTLTAHFSRSLSRGHVKNISLKNDPRLGIVEGKWNHFVKRSHEGGDRRRRRRWFSASAQRVEEFIDIIRAMIHRRCSLERVSREFLNCDSTGDSVQLSCDAITRLPDFSFDCSHHNRRKRELKMITTCHKQRLTPC